MEINEKKMLTLTTEIGESIWDYNIIIIIATTMVWSYIVSDFPL